MSDTRFKSETGLYVVGDAEMASNLTVDGTLSTNGNGLAVSSAVINLNLPAVAANTLNVNGSGLTVLSTTTTGNLNVLANATVLGGTFGNTTNYTVANTSAVTVANVSATFTQGSLTLSNGNLSVNGTASSTGNTSLVGGMINATANSTVNKIATANAFYEVTQGLAGYTHAAIPSDANTGSTYYAAGSVGFNYFGTKLSARTTGNTSSPYAAMISYSGNTGILAITQGANSSIANGTIVPADVVLVTQSQFIVNLQSQYTATATFANTVVINGSQLTTNAIVSRGVFNAQANAWFDTNVYVGNSALSGTANLTVSNSSISSVIGPGQINVGTTITITNTGINSFSSSNTRTFVDSSGLYVTKTPTETAGANLVSAWLQTGSGVVTNTAWSRLILSANSSTTASLVVSNDPANYPQAFVLTSGSNQVSIAPQVISIFNSNTSYANISVNSATGIKVGDNTDSNKYLVMFANSSSIYPQMYLQTNSTVTTTVQPGLVSIGNALAGLQISPSNTVFAGTAGAANLDFITMGANSTQPGIITVGNGFSNATMSKISNLPMFAVSNTVANTQVQPFGIYSSEVGTSRASSLTSNAFNMADTGAGFSITATAAIFNSNNGIRLPNGNTANRPTAGTPGGSTYPWGPGTIRWNTDVSQVEVSTSGMTTWRYLLTSATAATTATTATPTTVVLRDATADIYANNFYSTSDVTLKENLTEITGALDKLDELTGYIYNFIGDDKRQYGLSAQNVEKTLPEAVGERNGTKAVSYQMLIPVIIEAIKELKTKVNEISNGNQSKPRS